jgi:hypothetical protein
MANPRNQSKGHPTSPQTTKLYQVREVIEQLEKENGADSEAVNKDCEERIQRIKNDTSKRVAEADAEMEAMIGIAKTEKAAKLGLIENRARGDEEIFLKGTEMVTNVWPSCARFFVSHFCQH